MENPFNFFNRNLCPPPFKRSRVFENDEADQVSPIPTQTQTPMDFTISSSSNSNSKPKLPNSYLFQFQNQNETSSSISTSKDPEKQPEPEKNDDKTVPPPKIQPKIPIRSLNLKLNYSGDGQITGEKSEAQDKKRNSCPCCGTCLNQNQNLESLFSQVKFECKYRKYGCPEMLSLGSLEHHSRICKCRPIFCTQSSCTNREVRVSEYLDHLKEVHKIQGESRPDGEFHCFKVFNYLSLTRENSLYYLIYDGQAFIQNFLLENRTVHLWISLIDEETNSTKYWSTITLYSNKNKSLNESTLPVHHIRRSFESILNEGSLDTKNWTQLKPFLVHGVETHLGRFNYGYNIKIKIFKSE